MTTITENTKKAKTIRSTQELTARYARFCANNDFNADITPENQYANVETERQQKWLDAHMTSVEQAEMQGVRLARGRTDIVREIANDIAHKNNPKAKVNKVVNAVKSVAKKAIQATIEVVFVESAPAPLANNICAPAPVQKMTVAPEIVDKKGQYGFSF
jgi:hypothetical protein